MNELIVNERTNRDIKFKKCPGAMIIIGLSSV